MTHWGWMVMAAAVLWGAPTRNHAQPAGSPLKPPRLVQQLPVQLPAGVSPAQDVTVLMRLTVDEAGEVIRVDMVESGDAVLDHAAMGAACAFGFEPAEMDGVPTAVSIHYRYTFTATAAATPSLQEAPQAVVPPPLPEPNAQGLRSAFSGVILDDVSHQPVADVEVYVDIQAAEPLTASTSELGRFEFPDVPAGRHLVALTATGFEQFSVVEEFHAGELLTVEYPIHHVATGAFETVVRDRSRRAGRVSMVVGSVTAITEKDLEPTLRPTP